MILVKTWKTIKFLSKHTADAANSFQRWGMPSVQWPQTASIHWNKTIYQIIYHLSNLSNSSLWPTHQCQHTHRKNTACANLWWWIDPTLQDLARTYFEDSVVFCQQRLKYMFSRKINSKATPGRRRYITYGYRTVTPFSEHFGRRRPRKHPHTNQTRCGSMKQISLFLSNLWAHPKTKQSHGKTRKRKEQKLQKQIVLSTVAEPNTPRKSMKNWWFCCFCRRRERSNSLSQIGNYKQIPDRRKSETFCNHVFSKELASALKNMRNSKVDETCQKQSSMYDVGQEILCRCLFSCSIQFNQ